MANVEALDKWADVLGYVADPDFNLGEWCNCAAGHFGRDEYAIKNGLTTDSGAPVFMGHIGTRAIAAFFKITLKEAGQIIHPDFYGAGQYRGARGRAQAIKRIKALADHYRNPARHPAPNYENVDSVQNAFRGLSPLYLSLVTA